MLDLLLPFVLLAQEQQKQQQPGNPLMTLLMPMIVIGVLWYFMLLRPQQKERSRRQDLLNQLKKNDKIVTIGGIKGTVASISEDGEEVTIKVDDNTRIRMLRNSIQTVESKEKPSESQDENK